MNADVHQKTFPIIFLAARFIATKLEKTKNKCTKMVNNVTFTPLILYCNEEINYI